MDSYYSNSRPEMLSFVMAPPSRVLDIGCGMGSFGAILKGKYNCEVCGIEPSEQVAAIAKQILDKVYVGTFEKVFSSLPLNSFDLIVLNDSLEHMPYPNIALNCIRSLLVDSGHVVISVPNVRFVENVFNLVLKKDWNYIDYGVLDKTHLRFFTKKSLSRLLTSSEFSIVKISGINPIKSRLFALLNLISFGIIDDMKWLQIGCIAVKNCHS